MAITAQERLVLDSKTANHSGLHYMRRNPHPKKERHGDCGVRAICLAFDLDYDKVWKRATSNKRNNAPVYCYSDGTGSHYYERSKATATWGLSKDDLIETLQDFDRQAAMQRQNIGQRALQAGAFGGSRSAVQDALAGEALSRQLGEIHSILLKKDEIQAFSDSRRPDGKASSFYK